MPDPMTPDEHQKVSDLFLAAVDLSAEARARFLAQACAGDDRLRREVESLLSAHGHASTFIETPALLLTLPGAAAPSRIGPYDVIALIGAGGMGEVYRARDPRLGRTVALKVLPVSLAGDPMFRERFEREARSAAALSHPHICTIFDVGPNYLVMEHLEGVTLAQRLSEGPVPLPQALEYGAQIADAVAAAHTRGIVHRDLKPANVMLTPTGAKVLDFGLAKQVAVIDADADAATVAPEPASAAVPPTPTRTGEIIGTTAYMSPEQAEGKPVDTRSDVFALGVVFYEMLGGRRPFTGDSMISVLASILKSTPEPLRRIRREVPEHVERVVRRCLEKDPAARYPSAINVARELARYRAAGERPRRTRLVLIAAAAALVAIVGTLGVRVYMTASRARWVEQTAVPEITRLLASDRPLAARKIYREADAADPASPALFSFRQTLSTPVVSIRTTPPGAEVDVLDYVDDQSSERGWERLGISPVTTDRIPYWGYYRLRVAKAGFATIERPLNMLFATLNPTDAHLDLVLTPASLVPKDMVVVEAIGTGVAIAPGVITPGPLPQFLLDKHEVSNREFKAFVEARAYQSRANWTEEFVDAGRLLPWEEAMVRLHDATSRAGPATWQLGTFPDGTGELPVDGVSWYEAAAYCSFAGKTLPTAYHWFRAAGGGLISSMLQLSNFRGQGAEPVGQNRGLSEYGALDMAGNVKEWTASTIGTKKAILGGGWDESSYAYHQLDAREPFAREKTFGFRCARFIDPPSATLFQPVVPRRVDRRGSPPVSDDVYRAYEALYRYDHTALEARIESVDDSTPYFHQETVSLRAAYGNERVVAHLFLPRNATPPYQTVVFVPSGNIFSFRSVSALPDPFEFLVRAGRAVLVIALQGTLDRGPAPIFVGPNEMRDRLFQWSKDIGRSIDYLETRQDIDVKRLAFYGISYGSGVSPTLLATEPRFSTAVLVSGGDMFRLPAEADPWTFAPRVRIPVLMLNGRDDLVYPVETAQIPLFRAFGTPEPDKRHLLFDGGHVNLRFHMDLIGEILKWLDRYLGPVATNPNTN